MPRYQIESSNYPFHPQRTEKMPKMLLAAVGSLLMLAALDQTIVSTALPTIMKELEAF